MILAVLFLLLTAIPLYCLFRSIKDKGHNIGFLLFCVMLSLCDLLCFWLLLCKRIDDAAHTLALYYVCCSWLCLGVLLLSLAITRRKYYPLYSIPSIIICICQSLISMNVLSNNSRLPLGKYEVLGNSWWVIKSKLIESNNTFYNFNNFRILLLANAFIILITMYICLNHSANTFRARFYSLMAIHLLIAVLDFISWKLSLPVWIVCFVLNAYCVVGLYFTCYYSDRKLKNWSLGRFANEMSDGFLLYNEHGDLIQVNDLLKYAFPPLVIKSFEFKENLDEWLSDTITIENMEIIKYELDGKDTYFKAKKTELMDYDSYLGTIYILHDTTESILKMRAMEEAKAELEKAAKMKADFLANMSHEIRTPMNAVIGMAEIALRDEKDPDIKDYLLQIKNSGGNLLNIINDILDFSKIEAGKMEIIPDRYEPVTELTEIANVLATRIGDKDVELFFVIDNKIPHALEGDIMRIRQVLINLANNAIKFTQKGFVSIVLTVEYLSENTINLLFHVIDTGQGIKSEDLEKLFVSFQQVDSKRNRSVEGTGLGLAISQRLCEAMHGKIGVTSEYGKGSDFYFSIPQKILDPSFDIVVEEADKKYTTVVDDYPELLDKFIEEINKLGVHGKAICKLTDFVKSDGMDFVFFRETSFNDEFVKFLKDNPDVTGVILVNFDSTFTTDIPNLRIMRKPETSINMVKILNGKDFAHDESQDDAFKIDFIAPDAKILIVDDNAINITVASGLIKPIKSKCFGADSGKKAIEMIKQEDFDIILMDHMMPDMDGVETTHVIRETIPKALNTPIIALTANALEGVKEMFLNEGMNDFVAKPVDIRNLATKLKQWLPEDKIVITNEVLLDENDTESEVFVEYKGLDNEKAIKALGSENLYETIVKEYYRSGYTKRDEIIKAYDNNDWPDYIIKVHALKSSSRQIGAYELGDMAEELELAGKNNNFDIIHEKTAATLDKFTIILNDLAPYFVEEEVDAKDLIAITDDALQEIINRLSNACDDLDMDEMEACKEELQKYSYDEARSEIMSKIYTAIDDIDVDTCISLIEELNV